MYLSTFMLSILFTIQKEKQQEAIVIKYWFLNWINQSDNIIKWEDLHSLGKFKTSNKDCFKTFVFRIFNLCTQRLNSMIKNHIWKWPCWDVLNIKYKINLNQP